MTRYKTVSNFTSGGTSNFVKVKAENYYTVGYDVSGTQPLFGTNNYINVYTMLGSSNSFAEASARYMRYKITGMSIRFDSSLTETAAASYLQNQYPTIAIAFFPDITSSTTRAIDSLFNDKKVVFATNVKTFQRKYWHFPDSMIIFDNGGGYGMWNCARQYNSLLGQLSIYSPTIVSATGEAPLGNVCVTVYCQFSNLIR